MDILTEHFPHIRTRLLDWFATHRRPLPWRSSYTPYETWVAEIMMQQTQMERGVAYFLRWMKLFPTIEAVANASESALLSAWEGLGYYRRVRMLQEAARVIMEQYRGEFPHTYEKILTLPGVGAYTAGAIASTAFNIPVPCVDGNVERVLSRLFNIDTPVKAEPAKSLIRKIATDLIPQGYARDFNQSLMELGALVCSKVPQCKICPLIENCISYREGIAELRPVIVVSKKNIPLDTVCGIWIRDNNVLVQHRQHNGGIWAGLTVFPHTRIQQNESLYDAIRRLYRDIHIDIIDMNELTTIHHKYTKYDITLHAFFIKAEGTIFDTHFEWVSLESLQEVPLPAPHRKIANIILHGECSVRQRQYRTKTNKNQLSLL